MKVSSVMISVTILLLALVPIFAEETENVLISGTNTFAGNIYKEILKKEEKNFLFSPFSAQNVLALAYSGSRDQTAEELRSSLHLPKDQSLLEKDFRKILSNLKDENEIYVFNTANKLYVDQNFTIKESFQKITTDVFNAKSENINFSEKVVASEKINKWVEEKTENKIHDLVEPDKLGPDVVALLVNALYFKGNWSDPFDHTRKEDFYQIDKKTTQVEMMHFYVADKILNYAENLELDAKFLELPFQGKDISMLVILPNKKDGIQDLEKQIDKVIAFQNFSREYVNVLLPKFKIESKIDFKEILTNLGVKKAFIGGEANFKGISDAPIFISDVIQKTFIDVNEDGVEAAAATFAGIALESAHISTSEPKQFVADHPFIYFIKVKGLIVFAGRVASPN